MNPIPLSFRIRIAARLWQFVGVVGILVAGLQILKDEFRPDDSGLLLLIPYLVILVCLFLIVSGSLAVRLRWNDILIPSSIANALGFPAMLYAAAMLASKSFPVTSNHWDNVLLRRPPADACLLGIMGSLLLLGGCLVLTRRRDYRNSLLSHSIHAYPA